jgi:hypothetical protein
MSVYAEFNKDKLLCYLFNLKSIFLLFSFYLLFLKNCYKNKRKMNNLLQNNIFSHYYTTVLRIGFTYFFLWILFCWVMINNILFLLKCY